MAKSTGKAAKKLKASKHTPIDPRWIVTDSDREAVKQGCYFDLPAAERVRDFIRDVCVHTQGPDAGKPFELLPWQWERVIAPAFGWKMPDGTRRFKEVEVWIPKKNGKSTLMAAIALYLLIADGEYQSYVYSAASDRNQAAMIYDTVVSMIKLNKELQRRLSPRKTRKVIEYKLKDSKYEVLSADGFRNEGLNIHGLLFDEMHAQRNRKLWASLRYGGAARKQSIRFIISTAGEYDEESLWWERFHLAKDIQENRKIDIHLLPCVYGMEENDDPMDPDTWRKCNPSWGHTLNRIEFERDAAQANISPANMTEFLRYRLNYTKAVATTWIDKKYWDNCRVEFNFAPFKPVVSYLGIDLAETSDLVAEVRLDFDKDSHFRIHPKFYAPSQPNNLRLMQRNRYERWEQLGLLNIIEGPVIRTSPILESVYFQCRNNPMHAVGVDRYHALEFGKTIEDWIELQRLQIQLILCQYTTMGMNEPTRVLEEAIYGAKCSHDGNAIMNYMFRNITVAQDSSGNRKLDKSNRSSKIDGFAAILLGLFAKFTAKKREVSKYVTESLTGDPIDVDLYQDQELVRS